jgi:hypothetical protein
MIRLFTALWYKLVGEPSASKAVSNMEKAYKKLTRAVNFQKLKAEIKAEIAKLAAEAEAAAKEEADKAERIAKKVADLFELD